MKQILVATDFSTRSDRAMRRAILLARESSAQLLLVHAVDNDQPKRLVEAEKREATGLLRDIAGTVEASDGVACEPRVVLGDPFQAIVRAAEDANADLIVIGPHRRKVLRDVFVGTTAERTIRHSSRPVIMANAVPRSPYKRILVATDFSDCSAHALRTARTLGLFDAASVIVLHAFDAPAQGMMLRASTTTERLKDYINEEKERAGAEMTNFLRKVGFKPSRRITELIESSPAHTIRASARKERTDLVVVGTRGHTGVKKLLLGSVAREVVRDAQADVLAVPPGKERPAEAAS